MKYICAQGSRQGGRAYNEDRVAIAERDSAVLMVLGDGLGGHQGGAMASATLCQVAVRAFHAVRSPRIEDPPHFLALIMFQVHRTLRDLGRRRAPPIEPRTTCVLALVQEGCAYWAHVGDSRLYHLRNQAVISRTQDDTTIETFRERGILDDKESLAHPDKSRLLACLGGRQDPIIHLSAETALRAGDTLLLCSDGVWEAASNVEIPRALAHPVLENGLADLLLAAENRRRKAADNISAAALRWQDQPGRPTGIAACARRLTARAFWEEGRSLIVGRKLDEIRGAPKKVPPRG
ncbi:protein phosphatase 2C domain-containing protein [Acidiferrobacter sp.]|uniref:PP2C family protein-serine/threonine phosphatase n=1 Tax=Acidiferrobacter sp. TaxID=1872107 RepID=UPI0026216DC2|nr:protein phosphatase 2C domain-containing protein [Acidiferrobacter sp.]